MLQTRFSRSSLSPSAKALTTEQPTGNPTEVSNVLQQVGWTEDTQPGVGSSKKGACGTKMCRKMQQCRNNTPNYS